MNNNQKLAVVKATRRTEAYVGITKLESSRIFDLDPKHAVAYLKLRWLANFRTGWIGNESARVNPSVEKLLDAVSMNESEFKDLMNALTKAGLVAELSIDDQEIVLNLPLSVKGFEKVSKSTQGGLTNQVSVDSTGY